MKQLYSILFFLGLILTSFGEDSAAGSKSYGINSEGGIDDQFDRQIIYMERTSDQQRILLNIGS